METYSGGDQQTTELYMIPGTSSNISTTTGSPLQEFNTMGGGIGPELIVNQGLYYPAAANYYGYYPTGYESPGWWDDNHRTFGLDGGEFHSTALQNEGLQYGYFAPNYGYAQSTYNPYNPFLPGAVVGPVGQLLGTQQYIPSPAYNQPVSSPSYYPVFVQPSVDLFQTVNPDSSSLLNGGRLVASMPEHSVVGYMLPPTSVDTISTIPREASQVAIFQPHSERSQTNAASMRPAVPQGVANSATFSQISQGENVPISLETPNILPQGRSSLPAPLEASGPFYYGGNGFGSNVMGLSAGNNLRPRFLNNVNPDMLVEQNRGPRTSKPRDQSTSLIVTKAYTSKAGTIDQNGSIRIDTAQYNRDDFPVNYPNARFFVIKSYSEDDVHKSIKYNVWSSTPNGNKRLDDAYKDAQRISGGNRMICPVFLFFSVNASGQFCGVAEMIGPVDFHRDMDFWQQDKWSGSFPVKWHIVKDVPNTSFRHIVLENNENKPVTNSRDTQEIFYIPGLNMLSIFKDSPLRTSVLDDFLYYEERQRIILEERSLFLGRNRGQATPIIASTQSKVTVTIKAPPNRRDEKPDELLESVNSNSTASIVASSAPVKENVTNKEPLESDENPIESKEAVNIDRVTPIVISAPPSKVTVVIKTPPNRDENPRESNVADGGGTWASETATPCKANDKKDPELLSALKKIESLSITNDHASNGSTLSSTSISQSDVFTVGSMPVKVNGFAGSSVVLTADASSTDPNVAKQSNGTVTSAK